MNIIVHLMLEGNEPVICDPFCGSDCLSFSVPCNLWRLLCASRFLGRAVSIGTYRTRAVSAGKSCKRKADTTHTLQWFWSFWFEPLETNKSVAAQF